MKGVIYTTFADMVIEKYGLVTWDALITKVNPSSGAAYTTGMVYSDNEFFALVDELAKMKNISIPALVEEFGIYMFPVLAKKYFVFIKKSMGLKEFLKSIDQVIHVEIKKLHPDTLLPSMKYEDPNPHQLIMLYSSPRKLCFLATGLIRGAAVHFKEKIKVEQLLCMHQGGDHCRLEITFEQEK